MAIVHDASHGTNVGSSAPRQSWLGLFTYKQVWGLVFAKFLSDAAWYFYLFWLPKYLYDARGFDTKQVGYYAWIPYAASGFGSLIGGWFSSYLLKRGVSLNGARKWALGLSAAAHACRLLRDAVSGAGWRSCYSASPSSVNSHGRRW